MTIQGLINKIFRANQTQNNTVSWSGSNGLKSIQEDIVDTIRQRTFFTVPTTADLVNQGFNNAILCYVQDEFFYRWSASGTPNGTTIFPANDGGVWIQESVGTATGTVTSVGLTMPSAFTVSNSPVTTSGVIGVVGAGTTAQYVRGDGSLATFPILPGGGITSLNGLLTTVQTFATGTSGTDFNISSVTATHTFNLPTASGTNRGALSSSDWTTFNSKQNALTFSTPLSNVSNTVSISQANSSTNGYLSSTDWTTFNSKQNTITLTTTGTSGAATLVGSTLNIPQYQALLTNPVTGTGTTNYLSKWSSTSVLTDSLLYDNGTYVGIGTTSPAQKLDVNGLIRTNRTSNTDGGVVFGTVGTYLYGADSSGYLATYTSNTERMRIASNGVATINNLGGSGTRMVVADASGTLSTQAIPSVPTKSYGAWQTNTTQTAAVNNTGYGVKFDIGDITGHGVVIQPDGLGNNTLIKFVNAGTYNIQFSFQFQNADNQLHDVSIWLRKNGQNTAADVAGSGGFVSIPNSHGGTPGHCIVSWNYFVEANAADFFQLVWSTNNATNVTMQFYPAGSPPPSSASAILTVNQVD
jgi:hypothetical protein